MRKSAVLLSILFICNGFLFCQVTNSSVGGNYIYPQFYDSFSAEESWQIHKKAYLKQLNAEGLTADEIEKKLIIYENQKKEFIEKMEEQRKQADIQRQKAEEQRRQAEVQRKQAEELRKKAGVLRVEAEEQRKQADIQRKEAEKLRKEADVLRKEAEEQRKQKGPLLQKANEQRKKADLQFQKADELFKSVDIQFKKMDEQLKKADLQFQKADEQRKKADEGRNNFEKIIREKIILSDKTGTTKPLIFEVTNKTSLLFDIQAEIRSGNTQIEIFNPKGKKEGELWLEHNTKPGSISEEKITSGSLNKTISNADIGDWQIKILSQKSEGIITLFVAHVIKPTLDE